MILFASWCFEFKAMCNMYHKETIFNHCLQHFQDIEYLHKVKKCFTQKYKTENKIFNKQDKNFLHKSNEQTEHTITNDSCSSSALVHVICNQNHLNSSFT